MNMDTETSESHRVAVGQADESVRLVDDEFCEEDLVQEKDHFQNVVNAYLYYK